MANRGEIARRVFRTCRRLGIETVAVFSQFDEGQPHAVEADVAFLLPGRTAGETYLDPTGILEAAARAGADAIHPGYGFLSENADFAEAVTGAGLVWIGPTSESIRAMGSKTTAKALMDRAGVPILDGADLSGMDIEEATAAAMSVGYPLLVKASAGGGGKGMRIVSGPAQLEESLEGAKREALSSFGDATVFLEKYLTRPHHIEIQIVGDGQGDVISLFERECSIQRRHQKIIEESPSPTIDELVRQKMSDAAVAAGVTVGYQGVGTVEFLYEEGEFYFLEMNTRLQVEHPVTEMITGVDLVEIQIDIANGLPISDKARTARIEGHSVEVRLYAEDPSNDFLPVTGRVERFSFAPEPQVRVDTGVESGSTISVHYDPLLAKVISHGPTRDQANSELSEALKKARIHFPTTNRDLLVRILDDPEYQAGEIDTDFLNRRLEDLVGPLAKRSQYQLAARGCALSDQVLERSNSPVLRSLPSGWSNRRPRFQERSYLAGSTEYRVRYSVDGDRATFDDETPIQVHMASPERVVLPDADSVIELDIARYGTMRYVDGPDWSARLEVKHRFPEHDSHEATGSLHSPMPGKVIRVGVAEGDHVEGGAVLVVLEAMKMEHTIRAPYPGTIEAVNYVEGDQVDADAVLVVVTPE